MRSIYLIPAAAAALLLGGCVLRPEGTAQEKRDLEAAGQAYRLAFEQRALPELPDRPTWRDVLRRAFLANGDLEAAYFEWAMAVHRIDPAGTWPRGNATLEFERMFNDENLGGWDKARVEVAAQGTVFPGKTKKAAERALAEAQAAGRRFLAARLDLQRRVLEQWIDYALMAEQARIARDNVQLLRVLTETAANRVRAGAAQQDLLKAEIEQQRAEDELRTMEARLPQMRAMLNAMLARDPRAPLPPPETFPEARPLPAEDAAILAVGVRDNPELESLARRVQGRRDALALAKMEYVPDLNPFAGFQGSMEQWVGAMVMLPTALPAIRGMIEEARADLRATQAMARQARADRAAEFVATLLALRNSERQVALFEKTILPSAQLVLENSRQSYSTGGVGFIDLIDSQRTLLDVRLMIVEARAARERALARLEALAGADAEALARAATTAATRPTTAPTSATTTQATEHHHD